MTQWRQLISYKKPEQQQTFAWNLHSLSVNLTLKRQDNNFTETIYILQESQSRWVTSKKQQSCRLTLTNTCRDAAEGLKHREKRSGTNKVGFCYLTISLVIFIVKWVHVNKVSTGKEPISEKIQDFWSEVNCKEKGCSIWTHKTSGGRTDSSKSRTHTTAQTCCQV